MFLFRTSRKRSITVSSGGANPTGASVAAVGIRIPLPTSIPKILVVRAGIRKKVRVGVRIAAYHTIFI